MSFADAATPETAMLMRARGDDLRRAVHSDQIRMTHQPISEWRRPRRGRSPSGYLTLVAMLSAFDGDLDGARRQYEEAATVGEHFWGDASYVLHALSHVFLGALGAGWKRAAGLFDELLQIDGNQHLVVPAAWAHLASGNTDRGRELSDAIRIDDFTSYGEHILGGNTLIAAAEVALLTDNQPMATAAEQHLTPFAELMLGLPWAPSLAAADSLARLAARRGDSHAATQYAAIARRVYGGLGAPALLARLDS
jgi:hypothetical protein